MENGKFTQRIAGSPTRTNPISTSLQLQNRQKIMENGKFTQRIGGSPIRINPISTSLQLQNR
jgi:hypothetical protein